MEMTVFEISHTATEENHRLSFIIACNKYTNSNFTTKEYYYGFSRIKYTFKHDKDKNTINITFSLLANKENEKENVNFIYEETNYSKQQITAAMDDMGEVRYISSYGNELIFCINISVCIVKEKKLAKLTEDRNFNFVISASDENTVVVHKLWIRKDKTMVKEDISCKGVTLKELAGKISKVKKEMEIKLNENDISGNRVDWTAVLDYVDEKHVPELASAILKTTPGFVVFSYVAIRNSSKSKTNENLPDKSLDFGPFVVIHQNVQSFKDKITRINDLNSTHTPDVLALSEVFNRKAEMERVQLNGYVLAHCNCRTSVAHGGAAIYTRDGLQYTKRDDLQEIVEQVHFEITAIEITHLDFVVIALYRTGNGKFTKYLDKLELLLDKLTDEGKRFLIAGDHNVHEITDDNFKRRQRRKVEYILHSYGCVNTVKFPTRGDASLDCGIANYARNDLVVTPIDANISDHTAQYYVFTTDQWNLKNNAFKLIEVRLFNDGAIYLLYQDIVNNIDTITDNVYAGELDVNKAFNELFEMLSYYVDLHFPLRKNKTVPCLDEKMKKYLLECNEFAKLKRDYPVYTVVSKFTTNLMFESRQKFVMNRLKECLPISSTEQEKWRENRINQIELLQEDPNKFVNRNDVPLFSNSTAADAPDFDFPIVTREQLDKTFLTILEYPDKHDVSLNIIYCLWPAISKCLVVLMNALCARLRQSCVYPDVLKSNFHSRNETDYGNSNKPISILPIVTETVETILANNIMCYLDENHLLADKHYSDGRRVAATMTAESIFHRVVTDLNNTLKVAGIFCDLSTVFNTVSQKHLLNKIYDLGIRNNALSLIQSFLQMTGSRDSNADNNVNVNSGLPQGSVLGDALFLLYLNDVSKSIDIGQCVLAPDARTAIIIVSEDSYDTLKTVIDKVFNQLRIWLQKSGFPNVNVEIMNFSARVIKNPPLRNYPLCENYEFFGFTLDANLTFKLHVDSLCDKLSSAVFALRKVRPIVSKEALKRLYYKYFHLPMSYGILVWGNSVDSENVLGIQIRALRTLEGVPANYVDSKELFRKHSIFTHYSQYVFELLTFTRVNNFTRQPYRLKLAANNPRIGGPELFSKLPATLKNAPLETFKSNLKKLLLDNPLYSVEEFTKLINKNSYNIVNN